MLQKRLFREVGDESPQGEKAKTSRDRKFPSTVAGSRRDITDEGRNGGESRSGKVNCDIL